MDERKPTRYHDVYITKEAWQDTQARESLLKAAASDMGFEYERYVETGQQQDGTRGVRIFGR